MLGEFYFTSSKARYFTIHDSERFHILHQQNISLKLFPGVQIYLSKRKSIFFAPHCQHVWSELLHDENRWSLWRFSCFYVQKNRSNFMDAKRLHEGFDQNSIFLTLCYSGVIIRRNFLQGGYTIKATCIVGSARSSGSTAYLIDTIAAGMREAGVAVTKYCIGKENLRYCLGCKKCYIDGECVHHDTVKQIVSDILSSDFVVIAAPSYWADVPGQLKTLFERNTPYGGHESQPNFESGKANQRHCHRCPCRSTPARERIDSEFYPALLWSFGY